MHVNGLISDCHMILAFGPCLPNQPNNFVTIGSKFCTFKSVSESQSGLNSRSNWSAVCLLVFDNGGGMLGCHGFGGQIKKSNFRPLVDNSIKLSIKKVRKEKTLL